MHNHVLSSIQSTMNWIENKSGANIYQNSNKTKWKKNENNLFNVEIQSVSYIDLE